METNDSNERKRITCEIKNVLFIKDGQETVPPDTIKVFCQIASKKTDLENIYYYPEFFDRIENDDKTFRKYSYKSDFYLNTGESVYILNPYPEVHQKVKE